MKKSIKSIVVLVLICAVVSVIMAITNYITYPIIEKNEQQKASGALLEILPDGGSFEQPDNGGYAIKLTTTGYSTGMVIMCGISPDGKVVGTKLVSSSETPSIGGVAAETYKEKVMDKDISNIDGVDTIAGATKTTAAYRSAVKDALNTVVILGGGNVDLRSDEEILNDSLSEALPSAEGGFEKHFFVEETKGVDAIYVATNKTGVVCVIGESFVAVDENGNVISDCEESVAQIALSAFAKINSAVLSDIDLSAYENLPKHLVNAKRTQTGNYVMEIKGAGYGITGGDEYHPASGEYILIKVSMTKDGKVIDCLTLSQAETAGIGSVCADEAFYGQFDGKTPETYGEIDAISGATLTTDGYKKAIVRAFECVKIFEGVK